MKLAVDRLYKNEEDRFNFIIQLILTFRLNMDSVMEMFDTEKLFGISNTKEMFEYIYHNGYSIHSATNYCLIHDQSDQELAKSNCKKFFDLYVISLLRKDIESVKEYRKLLSDSEYHKLENKNYMDLSDDEFWIVLKFQLKYALTSIRMAGNDENYSKRYRKRAYKMLEQDEILLERFKNMEQFYSESHLYKRGK